jgi:hypothetical protein
MPNKIQLSSSTEDIRQVLTWCRSTISYREYSWNWKNVGSKYQDGFITAVVGGGTGTGAAPVPFNWRKRYLTVGNCYATVSLLKVKCGQERVLIGIEKLRKQVDSSIVINNNKLWSLKTLVLKQTSKSGWSLK